MTDDPYKRTFAFRIILRGVIPDKLSVEAADKAFEEASDLLYTVGCDDALVGAKGSDIHIAFDRGAGSLEYAVRSGLTDVMHVWRDLRPKGIEILWDDE
jgi:hypothetical protein